MKLVLIAVAYLYLTGYGVFRYFQAEVRMRDCETYVIFPNSPLGKLAYNVWRPLTYADAALTNMRFHIGAHRELTS
jgi:hypothetical protein